jgi:hypothetical protein
MNGAVLKNPLVRGYLRELNAACATLPAGRARELREQITAHLAEALPPGASYAEVEAELRRLGPARSLAAEAAGPLPSSAVIRLRNRLSRLRWWAWTSIAAVVILIAGGATYLNSVIGAEPLLQGGIGTWWFPQDHNAHGTTTSAAGVTQISVPERWGQQQGIVVGVSNMSDWTQTIIGPSADSLPGSLSPVQFAVGSGPPVGDSDTAWTGQTRWNLPGSIPPHSYRLLRILWTSRVCLTPGATMSLKSVTLRVRVGLVTRTENIQLAIAWGLTGTRTSEPASACH